MTDAGTLSEGVDYNHEAAARMQERWDSVKSLFNTITGDDNYARWYAIGTILPSIATKKIGVIGTAEKVASKAKKIASITRVSSNVANKPFITKEATAAGWHPPYPANVNIRQITTANETQFLRFYSGEDPIGRFLVRKKEVMFIINNPEKLKIYLGLKEVPTTMVDVYVPENTNMLVGRIGSQPNFGLINESGFQYQLIDKIPESSYKNPRPIS